LATEFFLDISFVLVAGDSDLSGSMSIWVSSLEECEHGIMMGRFPQASMVL